ncbi:hypothetical protein K402DRAFT_353311 [Aulographum hederae CBS 113979]|uniref:Increased loss of mitochondrial DNA protein 1 n=1 Tax=Aulographum hederae CBS 113979 TaxID=1176131 RepID=A0A6G1H3U4_9PEZI|nr:hypothetical protein K402DRAFT_353311 [Aulographum hederae CBS 113979]
MALISAFTIIRGLSLFHITLAFLLLTAPAKVADQNVVFMLGEAMHLPHTTSFNSTSPPIAFLAAVFAFFGLADLTAVSMNELIAIEYWSSQAPVRLFFLFILTGYTYVAKPGGLLGVKAVEYGMVSGPGDHLKNSIVFTWSFLEVICWFWIFVSLRDERRNIALREIEKRKAEEDRL